MAKTFSYNALKELINKEQFYHILSHYKFRLYAVDSYNGILSKNVGVDSFDFDKDYAVVKDYKQRLMYIGRLDTMNFNACGVISILRPYMSKDTEANLYLLSEL